MLEKHSVSIAGHKTSFTLEPEFWEALKKLASAQGKSVAAVVASLDKEGGNLSSKIRVWVLKNCHSALSP
jgi:predicted DNA-binding ribbon-helix-helix protein